MPEGNCELCKGDGRVETDNKGPIVDCPLCYPEEKKESGGLGEFVDKTLTIPALKLAASDHYQAYHREKDAYDCGHSLAEEVSPKMAHHKRRFNELMDKLADLDPECPGVRL
ncbi:MAG: hypothetical protein KZQ93_15935 [Candidatus Thiodiazotropha sp. (ex Monitilora ramsayi)]|nr:hypothetical protein [Candidatus Thiodiazotropha sp. (ex Monitilora ramsayi)]